MTNEPMKIRSEQVLRDALKTLCNFVWRRGKLSPGEHIWTIPADPERDFDCILSDAIDELVARRAAALPAEAPQDNQGRLMLNSYGRQCYDAGYAAAKAAPPQREQP